ncbi:MAG TPA: hypothetical protein VE934_04650 [Polaromonas sp.]|uniref:hypothetical protein n=1 Tax=Polaromonas sp. TaxID=1869339 RepID=UPI002D4A8F10|nr:hypothetical protein [Polaromonas sp.]HYW56224.1 hypothetical protein [Polaromonas sp.]
MAPHLVGAQTVADDVVHVIENLRKKIQWISTQTASQADYRAAETESAEELRQLVAKDPSDRALTRKDLDGVNPLMLASAHGFPGLVNELLKSEKVKASINDIGPNNTTSWMFANFAFRQTLWACRPQILSDPFSWVPIFQVQPYYKSPVEDKPYLQTRQALEKAGAKIDLSTAKNAWLERCPNSAIDTQVKVKGSSDLLLALEAEGDRILERHHARTLSQAAPAMENASPQVVGIVLDDVELPQGFSIKNPSPSLGELPGKLTGWWSGNLLLAGEILFAFEEFVSANEVTVLMIAKGRSKPYKGRRLNMTLDGATFSSTPAADSQISLTMGHDGKLVATFSGRGPNFTLSLRRAQQK